jgi:hypothetical protein
MVIAQIRAMHVRLDRRTTPATDGIDGAQLRG